MRDLVVPGLWGPFPGRRKTRQGRRTGQIWPIQVLIASKSPARHALANLPHYPRLLRIAPQQQHAYSVLYLFKSLFRHKGSVDQRPSGTYRASPRFPGDGTRRFVPGSLGSARAGDIADVPDSSLQQSPSWRKPFYSACRTIQLVVRIAHRSKTPISSFIGKVFTGFLS